MHGVASDVNISNQMLFVEGPRDDRRMYVVLDLEWNNAWNNTLNHDAVWLFGKFLLGEDGYRHARLKSTGHEVLQSERTPGLKFRFEVPEDGAGVFVVPASEYRGPVFIKIKLAIDPVPLANVNPDRGAFRVFALEMVYIPQGGFYAGETDSLAAVQYAAFYKPDDNGRHSGPAFIASEDSLRVGLDIAYLPRQTVYHGDGAGVVPALFPKGFRAFYIMKYEITQGQYADFLQSLSRGQSQLRSNFGGKGYYDYRGTISCTGERYTAARPARPCNFLSWDDALAFADWCALRPMTELEYEKACRGGRKPVANEFPWGNADKLRVERQVNADGDLVLLNGKTELDRYPRNLEEFGASAFWVMDLSGSLWERCITIGDSTGRAFRGTHGDGVLSYYGFATNDDWPAGVSEQGGFGFRGGGFYHPDRSYHEFNPFSPVSYRPYGAWSGGNRTEAYGSRLVRTQ